MKWSPLQERALSLVSDWKKSGGKDPFYLAGYAGTGKTTLAKDFASAIGGQVCFAAFTGKAAHVLRQKGCPGATTIHSLIYTPTERSKQRLRHLQEELDQLINEIRSEVPHDDRGTDYEKNAIDGHPLVIKAREQINNEMQGLKSPSFSLNLDSELRHADLLVIDECSMVDEKMGEDLLSFGVPTLVLGDPAQLPPVKGAGYFTDRKPDLLLTEIHRQAEDNPIIRMATDVREGRRLEEGDYGESRVITMDEGETHMYTSHDQILCGREKPSGAIYRRNLNRRVRQIMGRNSVYPVPGDKLVCLRNDHEEGLLNGSLWSTLDCQEVDINSTGLTVKGESGLEVNCVSHARIFRGEEVPFYEMKEAQHFDYGYVMTCHKAQGSQWPSVLIFDQSPIFRENARKWLYTAITRAAERVTVIRC